MTLKFSKEVIKNYIADYFAPFADTSPDEISFN
jgi:hypothetical protein